MASQVLHNIHQRASNVVNTVLYASQIFSLLQSQEDEETSTDILCRRLFENEQTTFQIGWFAADYFTARDLQRLSLAMKCNTSVQHISVGWSLRPRSLLVILEALSHMRHVQEISLILHADLPEWILRAIHRNCSSLRVLDIRNVQIRKCITSLDYCVGTVNDNTSVHPYHGTVNTIDDDDDDDGDHRTNATARYAIPHARTHIPESVSRSSAAEYGANISASVTNTRHAPSRRAHDSPRTPLRRPNFQNAQFDPYQTDDEDDYDVDHDFGDELHSIMFDGYPAASSERHPPQSAPLADRRRQRRQRLEQERRSRCSLTCGFFLSKLIPACLRAPPPCFASRQMFVQEFNVTTVLPYLLKPRQFDDIQRHNLFVPSDSINYQHYSPTDRLQSLKLMDCDIQMEQVMEMASLLAGDTYLGELCLAHNTNIPAKGLQALLKCNVRRLDFTGCEIPPPHIRAMADTLSEIREINQRWLRRRARQLERSRHYARHRRCQQQQQRTSSTIATANSVNKRPIDSRKGETSFKNCNRYLRNVRRMSRNPTIRNGDPHGKGDVDRDLRHPIQELCLARNQYINSAITPLLIASYRTLRHLDLSYTNFDVRSILRTIIDATEFPTGSSGASLHSTMALRELVLQGYESFPDSCLYRFLVHPTNKLTRLVITNPENRAVVTPDTLYQVIEGVVHNYEIQCIEMEWGSPSSSALLASIGSPTTGSQKFAHHHTLFRFLANNGIPFSSISIAQRNRYTVGQPHLDSRHSSFDVDRGGTDDGPVTALPYSYAVYREHVEFYLRLNMAGRAILRQQHENTYIPHTRASSIHVPSQLRQDIGINGCSMADTSLSSRLVCRSRNICLDGGKDFGSVLAAVNDDMDAMYWLLTNGASLLNTQNMNPSGSGRRSACHA